MDMENNYTVLYNKYRPHIFSDVVGQKHITDTLKNEVKTNRIAHAYLFVGSRGTGKTTCARILAKAVNCDHPNDGDPCNKCSTCQSINDGVNMDIMEIDAASNNGVDQMRELQEQLIYAPTSGKYRVVIIDEVHMLSTNAFNALLKILEEPPKHVIFILATTEANKVLPTIVSRCQRFDFKRISNEDIASRLEYVMKHENRSIDHSAAMVIASMADGGMRDALSILDRVAYLDTHITEDRVRGVLGLPDSDMFRKVSQAICKGQPALVMRAIAGLDKNRSMLTICDQLISFYRDIMVINMRGAKNEPTYVIEEAKNYSAQKAIMIMDALNECYQKMLNGHERITLEACLLKLANTFAREYDKDANPVIEALEAKVKELEKQVRVLFGDKSDAILKKIAEETPIAKSASETSTESESIKAHEETPVFKSANEMIAYFSNHAVAFAEWENITKTISRKYKDIGVALGKVKAYVYEGYVLIDFDDVTRKLLKTEENKTMLKKAIEYVTGVAYKIGPYQL